jgi:predicted RNase H-like HicB family nuclease
VKLVYEQDENGAWNVHVAERPGALTYGRSLAQARRRIQDVLPLFWDEPDELEWVEEVHLPGEAASALQAALEARERADLAQSEADKATRLAVEVLSRLGLSMRDAAALVGLSHQRIAQIAKSSNSRRRPSAGLGSAQTRTAAEQATRRTPTRGG